LNQISLTLGNCSAFYNQQIGRLSGLGIEASEYEVSHIAFRTETFDEYIRVRDRLEPQCTANVENTWNGRLISKLLLRKPLVLGPGVGTSLIELIPPIHQNDYRMGLEHLGFVVGDDLEDFGAKHRAVISGRQDQGPFCQPFFIRFADKTNVKFYRHGLKRVCELEGRRFDGFHHALGTDA
jgi:predicted metalloenzyme YecM